MGYQEIIKDKALRLFGAFLALSHIVCWATWMWDSENPLMKTVFNDLRALCWPASDICVSMRPFMIQWAWLISLVYLIFSIFALIEFLRAKNIKRSLILLSAAWALQCFIRYQDYRFMGNFHYMNAWTHLFFIFFPRRRQLLAYLIVSFYVSAGLLKFNREWLEGAAFIRPPMIQGLWLKIGCYYVVVLEMLLIPLLLFIKNKVFRYAVFFQIIAFHLFSWHIVGYLYPLTMFCLISIFPLSWYLPLKESKKKIDLHLSSKLAFGALAVFWIFQMIPWIIAGPSELTGEGRIFSSNMLDSRSQCENLSTLYYNDKTVEVSDYGYDWGIRIACDPWLQYQLALNHCRLRAKEDPGFLDMDWFMLSKRSLDEDWKISVHVENFCSRRPTYYSWKRNDWIRIAEHENHFDKKDNVLKIQSLLNKSVSSKEWRIELPHVLRRTGEVIPIIEHANSFYVPTNTGWLWKISTSGEILWKTYFNSSVLGVFPKIDWEDHKLSLFLRNGRRYVLDDESGRILSFYPSQGYLAEAPDPVFTQNKWQSQDGWKILLVGNTLSASR
jgi:hypothetical protein